MTDFRALCADLLDEVVARPLLLDRELIARARTALAEEPAVPQPQPPADGEVAELEAWLRSTGEGQPCLSDEGYARLTRAAELLQQQQVMVPVSVSERLPGPSDCAPWPKDSDASAWCWVGTDEDGGWNWEQRSAGCLAMFPDDFTHWLPATALPLPVPGAD